jgi:uncharacterized RDD family membrane protein YckC
MAALGIDLLFLHLMAFITTRFFPDTISRLGEAAPFLGLSAALLYLTLTNLAGRSLGRLVLRHEVVAIDPQPLLPKTAFLRALAVVGPLFLHQAAQGLSQAMNRPEVLSPLPPTISYGAFALLLAWYGTNFLFVAFDTSGRTLYDRWLGTQVIAADADPEDRVQLLQNSRELRNSLVLSPTGKFLAGLAVFMPFLLVGVFIISSKSYLDRNPDILKRTIQERIALHLDGFPPPVSRQPIWTTEAERLTTDTMGIQFDYARRGSLTLDDIVQNPRATSKLNRATSVTLSMWENLVTAELETTNSPRLEQIRNVRRIMTRVDFVQQADLFFASHPKIVYSTSQTVELIEGRVPPEAFERLRER